MDKLDWAVQTFRRANRDRLNLPFSHFMRKVAHVDPLEAAPRLRNKGQKTKQST